MKVLITGGLGYVGARLTEHLAARGFDVTTFSRTDRSDILRDCRFEKIFGSVESATNLKRLFSGRNWDAVIHLASSGAEAANSLDYAEKSLIVNALGTRNLLQAIADNGDGVSKTHFIYFSTFHVYGLNSGVAGEDETFPAPRNDYAATHLFAEYYVRQFHAAHKIPFTIFRLTNGYGAPKEIGDAAEWKLVLNDLARAAFREKVVKLTSNGRPRRDFVWLGDVCDAVEQCIYKGAANDVFNLGGGASVTMLELAQIVKAAYEKKFGAPIEIETNVADTNEYGDALAVSIEKLRRSIDFEPRNKLFDEATAIFDLLEKHGKN